MGYSSRHGRRPDEKASKSAHSYVIRDEEVQEFLKQCDFPKKPSDVSLGGHLVLKHEPNGSDSIRHVIAIDGGYTKVTVDKAFPSSEMCFFQFGALIFSVSDLESLGTTPFIDPDDIAKLKNIQRLKLTLPIQNVTIKGCPTLTESIRRALHEFFLRESEEQNLNETLKWLIFEEYEHPKTEWRLSVCPNRKCGCRDIPLQRNEITADYKFVCPKCSGPIYLIDVFRLHEVIDDEIGAGGILGYVTTTIEQILMAHLIRLILKAKPILMKQVLFVKDGPLGFFGQTANMHIPMRALVRYLFKDHNLYMAGLEKSGAFVEHADAVSQILVDGDVLILDDEYIYKYIIPGIPDPAAPYGRSTYYGNKLIFKTARGSMYVISLPTLKPNYKPEESDFKNLRSVLTNIEKLRCDMYDNSLIPVALANKLVSLANHPSSRILQKFAIESVTR
jgi:hypothetical protein